MAKTIEIYSKQEFYTKFPSITVPVESAGVTSIDRRFEKVEIDSTEYYIDAGSWDVNYQIGSCTERYKHIGNIVILRQFIDQAAFSLAELDKVERSIAADNK